MSLAAPSAPARSGARPVSNISGSTTGEQLQLQRERDRSGSGSINMPSSSHQLPRKQHSSSNGTHDTAYAASSSSSSQHSQSQSSSSTHSRPPYGPVSLDELLHAHSNSSSKALASLTNQYNTLYTSHYEYERNEKHKLGIENTKLWSWISNLKKERDGLQRDIRDSISRDKEVRNLAVRIMELEAALNLAGVALPPSTRDRLSPADSFTTNHSGNSAGHTTPVAGSGERDCSNSQKRPSPGPRSISDSGPSTSGNTLSQFDRREHRDHRERQRSDRSERNALLETESLSASTSANSFATASSEPSGSGQVLSFTPSSPTASSASNATKSSRDREREKRRQQGTLTPTNQQQQDQQASYGGTITASPARNHRTNTVSSAPTAYLQDAQYAPSTHQYDDPQTLPNLTTSPVQTMFSGLGSINSSSSATSSSTGYRNDGMLSSETSSSEHLRMPKTSNVPISPALSHTSAFSGTGSGAGGRAPSTSSPRSPNYPPLSSPSPTSQRSPRTFDSSQNSNPYINPPTSATTPSASSSTSGPLSMMAGSTQSRLLRRRASSLDLKSTTERSPIPSRSATPPADIGALSPSSQSPTQYATIIPRTPPHPTFNQDGPNGLFSTPLVELPDGVRQYMIAQENGLQIPSPLDPYHAKEKRHGASPGKHLGGLGIGLASGADDNGHSRQQRLSSALHAATGQSQQQPDHLQTRNRNGRISPADQPQSQTGSWQSRNAILQEAYTGDSSNASEETVHASSPVRTARPELPGRSSSDRQLPPHPGSRAHPDRMYQSSQMQEQQQISQHQNPSYPSSNHHHQQQQQQPYQQAQQAPPQPSSRQPHIQQPPRREHHLQQRSRDDYGDPKAGAAPSYGLNNASSSSTALGSGQAAKCVSLVPGLLPLTSAEVINSSIKIADRQKEVVSFLIRVKVSTPTEQNDSRLALLPPDVPKAWIIEKAWSDLQNLDMAIKAKNAKANVRRIPGLPDKSLFKDHAPSKVDQRKTDLQKFLQGLCHSKLHELQDYCLFLTSNIVSDRAAPVSNPGYKAGYLTKKGRNFGGWTTRYYVLQGRLLEYYDTPGGQHFGAIDIKGASIGRQNAKSQSAEEFRHAFLIRAKDKTGEDTDHILCAESDEERDHWVTMLVCCVTGEYVPDQVPAPVSAPQASTAACQQESGRPPQVDRLKQQQPRSKGSKEADLGRSMQQPTHHQPGQAGSTQRIFGRQQHYNPDAPVPVAKSTDAPYTHHRREQSAGHSSTASGPDDYQPPLQNKYRRGPHGSDLAPSSSLPANLSELAGKDEEPSQLPSSSAPHRFAKPVSSTDVDGQEGSSRPKSPEKKIKISGPSGGAPIGPDFKRSNAERKAKAKSSFWDFAGRRGIAERPIAAPHRPVFGVPIQEAVEIARVKEDLDLPAVVFRCVQYLDNVKAENEEGIYRMSGSSAVIKTLKDRFNADGDVDLTTEYFDPHAVAGLLKTYFRELPVHIFTLELNQEFIKANEIMDRAGKVREVTNLVQQLPVANYSALRFLSAHLVKIVNKETINKMSVKNLGIVFSPTLAIPATLFSLFVLEFDRIFKEIDAEEPLDEQIPTIQGGTDSQPRSRTSSAGGRRRSRNSMLFTQSGADKLLEMVHDLEDAPEEDEQGSQSENELMRNYRSASPAYSNEEHAKERHKQKLTIDVNERLNRSELVPHSPSVASSTSPRHLNAPLRSPGLPTSPRHTEGFASAAPSSRRS